MNKRKLQDFAAWSKQNLEKQITISLNAIGICSEGDIKKARVQGDLTVIDGIEKTFDRRFHEQREQIINRIKTDGFAHTVESFAFTWFNRLIALRFMEIHNYLDHGFKLFPTEANSLPEILNKLNFAKTDLNLDTTYCQTLQENKKNEELYRYVIFQQCRALAKALPMLFSQEFDYLEYFIPTPLLFGETIINKIIEIDEADFKEDVEIIGWLYQFYIATKKAEVFASKETITKDTLPAVTQLFTPDWIVKYMAENSIGRVWLESYPTSPLRSDMKYYVDEAEQDAEVEEKLKEIRYKNVNPENIKVIEPACGSGHILVYCFDLLLKMYLEKGYSKRDIPQLILKNNLFGLDIDMRASQLASFALVMRARSIDNRFFEEARYIRPRVFEMIDSKAILHCEYNGKSYLEIIREYNAAQWQGENQLTNDELKILSATIDLFDNARVIGSLLKVNSSKYLNIRRKLTENVKEKTQADIFTDAFFDREFHDLLDILRLAHFLSIKYDVMITNPPYCGISSLEIKPKNYFIQNYPSSKTDMFAMFMDTNFIKPNGFLGMINMHSWMFLNSFGDLRKKLVKSSFLVCAIHLGAHAFDTIGGEIVQTIAFIKRDIPTNYIGTFSNLTGYQTSSEKEANFDKSLFYSSSKLFSKFPTCQYVYWAPEKVADTFALNSKLGEFGVPKSGIMTGNDDKFVRLWHEVSKINSSLETNFLSSMNSSSKKKWFPITRGGEFRKWYGNFDSVVNMENNGYDISHLNKNNFRLRDNNYYFKECATWTMISSNSLSVRYVPENILYGNGGPTFFPTKNLFYTIGLLNSRVANYFTKMLNPTINTIIDDIVSIPYLENNVREIEIIVKDSISLSKSDWDSFETSWDFKKHPLISSGKIQQIFTRYLSETKESFYALKCNEENINDFFINLYGLTDELSKEVDDDYVSISISDKTRDVKSLISYFIGVLFGRYSLVEDGLIYAGGTFNPARYGDYYVDEDGILPIYSNLGTGGSLTHRIIELIKRVYGPQFYHENIDFIAEALGKKTNETSEETLNRYINDDFYADHLRTYQKRPIYWMFSSGKSNGFKCLIYMHRYDENALAKINANYFQPATMYLRNQIEELKREGLSANEREKLAIERKRLALEAQLNEAREYGLVLDYMANQYLSIDLDDGVKVNYAKFQEVEATTNHGRVKKDLLVPIK